MNIFALIILMISTSAFSHADHAWNEDVMAYLSVSQDIPFIGKNKLVPSSDRIDMDLFRARLTTLTSGKARRNRPEGIDEASHFLKAEYEKLGFKVSFMQFGRGRNFIAEKKGTLKINQIYYR
jgi:hypothetical protein